MAVARAGDPLPQEADRIDLVRVLRADPWPCDAGALTAMLRAPEQLDRQHAWLNRELSARRRAWGAPTVG